MKQLRFGRITITWTYVSRGWWELHILPFFDISESRVLFGWLLVTVDIDTQAEGGQE